MKRRFALTILAAITGILAPRQVPAQATVYVSNISDTTADTVEALGANWLAAEFTTGADSGGYSLDSVDLLFSDTSGSSGSGFVLMLYANSSGQPDSSIGTLSGSSAPDTAGTYNYTASGITLSPSTPYWLVARPTALTGPYLWNYTASTSYTSSDGWIMNTARYDSSDAHGSYWTSNSGDALQFDVDATPVPEPQTIALAGLGLLFLRRKIRW
ncbi:MAG: choice-of-anchor R domain-containing protein [Verrucomicrobiota bacterium]